MSDSIRNPFTLSPITDRNSLIGRDKFYSHIVNYIQNTESVIIVGGRRMGKTSLLLTLKNSKDLIDTDFLYWDISRTEGKGDDYFVTILKRDFKNKNFSFENADEFSEEFSKTNRKLVKIGRAHV